jgi:cob(I)alamin adenosyltransferase
MANRLTKIYTRTGDKGETGLADGSRVAKDAARIEAMGAIDELNSTIGVLLAEAIPGELHELRVCLGNVQNDLFDLGGELSIPGHTILTDSHVTALEAALDTFNASLPPLKDFILPGGSRAAALAHVARTVCRRAERRVVTLAKTDDVPALACPYLNRLSDLLFVASRVLNRQAGGTDILWQPGKNRS